MSFSGIVIIIIIIIIVVTFMRGIYNYVPETDHVYKVYNVPSVVTVHGTCNAISHVKCSVHLHQHFPQCLYSAQYGCFV